MAVVIDATAGGANANSFVLLTEAQTYMDARLNGSLWSAATTDNQNRALVEATREINLLLWLGMRASNTQALNWPRAWCPNPDITYFVYNYFDSTLVPQRVKDATSELAFQFINLGTTDVASLDPTLGVIEKAVDVLRTRWQPYQKPVGLSRFPRVLHYIRPMLDPQVSGMQVIRG